MSGLRVRVLDDFDDPAVGARVWNDLLASAESETVFLTWEWQSAWWRAFGRGRLLLLLAERDGRAVTLAPLFCDGGMIFFVGSGGSDYLDFVGDVGDVDMLVAILGDARAHAPAFEGFRFYHVPEGSRTGATLADAAACLDLELVDEGELVAPALDLRATPEAGMAAANKKSLVRHERYLRRHGRLEVRHVTGTDAILPRLETFFDQHVQRWCETGHPSLFLDPAQRRFYELLTRTAGGAGWLRFTEVDWEGRPIAFHFGFSYRGRYLWYKPSFAIDMARRSPGEVLLRQLLLAAIDEDADVFDFGLGEEPFKSRFATRYDRVRTWGLYPSRARSGEGPGAMP